MCRCRCRATEVVQLLSVEMEMQRCRQDGVPAVLSRCLGSAEVIVQVSLQVQRSRCKAAEIKLLWC